MKIIILAAGKGTRVMPLTRNTPKPLLDLGHGKTLLEEQLNRIQRSNVIDEVVLVIGYLAEQIEAKIKTYKLNKYKITTVCNPFYESSNNLISLWLAKHEMNEDFIITNGDNLLDHDVFQDLVNKNKNGIFLTTSRKENYYDDDMKVILENRKVTRVSKVIDNKKANAESVGLVLVSGEKYREIFNEHLESLARSKEYVDKYWLEVFNRMHEKGITIDTFEIDGKNKWREIDFHLDLKEAKKLIGLNS